MMSWMNLGRRSDTFTEQCSSTRSYSITDFLSYVLDELQIRNVASESYWDEFSNLLTLTPVERSLAKDWMLTGTYPPKPASERQIPP
jgi:hypothetical protein